MVEFGVEVVDLTTDCERERTEWTLFACLGMLVLSSQMHHIAFVVLSCSCECA